MLHRQTSPRDPAYGRLASRTHHCRYRFHGNWSRFRWALCDLKRAVAVTKGYLVAFICFATKAVHFEVASQLSTSSFLAAFRRFGARRGLPSKIFSDNGTNFVGTHNELRELGRLLNDPHISKP